MFSQAWLAKQNYCALQETGAHVEVNTCAVAREVLQLKTVGVALAADIVSIMTGYMQNAHEQLLWLVGLERGRGQYHGFCCIVLLR
jgi:hypothetical protein